MCWDTYVALIVYRLELTTVVTLVLPLILLLFPFGFSLSSTEQCIIASAHHIDQIALGEIIYAFGYTGLQILQQIVIADMTTLRYRCVLSLTFLAVMPRY
jgi:hypothetical protein